MATVAKKFKVMVVDDDPDTRELVKDVLGRQDMDVVPAASGEECVKNIRKEKPDLVLLDIMMPKMSGWDTFEKLRKMYSLHGWNVYENIRDQTKGVKVAFLTVVEASPDRVKAMKEHGLSDYITKPFAPAELVARVKKILGTAMVFLGIQ